MMSDNFSWLFWPRLQHPALPQHVFAFTGSNLWQPAVQRGVHILEGNGWHRIGSTNIFLQW